MADDSSNRDEENMAAADDDAQFPTSSVSSTEGGTFVFNFSNFKEGLAKLVAVKQLPFAYGDDFAFEDYVKILNPNAGRVPRDELLRTIIVLYKRGKSDLIGLFANLKSKVSISCDIWSDHWEKDWSYISITCHWIDDDSWLMQKRFLGFRHLDDMHTPEDLSQLIFLVLEQYNLTSKVYSISVNNAISNATNIEDLKRICESSVIGSKFCHVVCVCHVLNLCVQDMLVEFAHLIKPIQEAMHYIRNKTFREWTKFCKINGMKPRNIMFYDPTRWDSAYILFRESFPYKELLCSFFMQNDYNVHLLPDHWVMCEKIFDILKTFHEVTFQLSRIYHPTAHLVLPNYCNVALVLNEYSGDEILKYCVEEMRRKWKKYLLDIPEISLIAIVLDPRIKLDGLQDLLTMYYDALIPVKDKDSPDPIAIVNNVKTCFHNIYNEYKLKHSRPTSESQEANTSSNPGLPKRLSLRERFKRFQASLELENYLDITFEFDETDVEELDILQWWSKRTGRFPILSLMAKEILTCPASTVDVEEVFNMRGNILCMRRSRLMLRNLNAQTCLGDWEKAEHRSQDLQENLEEESDFDTDEETTSIEEDTDHSEC